MDHLPHALQLLKQLQQVPYLASKNLYRVAHYFLEMDEKRLAIFLQALKDAHNYTVKCTTCWSWKEATAACPWCTSTKRNQKQICVIETWHDLYAIEKTGAYLGSYHVLGGAICPLDGLGPEDLTIESLIDRVSSGCDEVILAVNQTPEGEATASFIARKLENLKLSSKITCLSRGIPVGSSLESMDRLTIFKALSERRLF
jgi:recombination protein RecR